MNEIYKIKIDKPISEVIKYTVSTHYGVNGLSDVDVTTTSETVYSGNLVECYTYIKIINENLKD